MSNDLGSSGKQLKMEDGVKSESQRVKIERFHLMKERYMGSHSQIESGIIHSRQGCSVIEETSEDLTKAKPHYYRSAMVHLLCGVYVLVLGVLGFVIPLSSEISRGKPGVDYYVEVFDLYMYLVSVMFLIFIHICLSCDNSKQHPALWQSQALFVAYSTGNLKASPSPGSSSDGKPEDSLSMNESERRGLASPHDDHTLPSQNPTESENRETQAPYLYDRAEGVNFYLRLGAIGFATGSMIHDGFKVAQIFEIDDDAQACYGVLYMVTALAHLVFTFLQTHFIFKNHKLVINKYKAVMRLGLSHLVATNINVWGGTLIYEIAEDIKEKFEIFELAHTGFQTMAAHPRTKHEVPTNFTTHSVEVSHICEEEIDSLARTAARFLFPCTIEYSLISAAVVYKIYCSVGNLSEDEHPFILDENETSCHKAHRGLFIGLLVSILTLISISLFYVYQERDTNMAAFIFYSSEIILLLLGIFATLIGFIRMRGLHFYGDRVFVDAALLIISVFGVLVFNAFVMVSTSSQINVHTEICSMGLAASSLGFLESILQTLFILDGLGRCAKTHRQVALKPGRAILTFLLMCNLCLWMINTFEMERTETFPIHTDHYGALSWSIITHFCLPMLIFYRFHSSICLSDIWVAAYQFKKKHK